jgi:hypothetical protein
MRFLLPRALTAFRALAAFLALFALGVTIADCGPRSSPAPPPALLPGAASASAAPQLAAEPDPGGVARIAADIEYLASNELAGRGTGEPGASLAAEHISKRFAQLGLEPAGDPGKDDVRGFRQPFSVPAREESGPAKSPAASLPSETPAWNIIGRLPARPQSAHASEVVVLAAHYDHLGRGGPGSREPYSKSVHPGADDNASGTALLLEVARRLAGLPGRPARTVLFIAFAAEEAAAAGSLHWVAYPTAPLDRVVAMVNADMVGRMRDDRLMIDGTSSAAGWAPLAAQAGRGLGLDLVFDVEGPHARDHHAFAAENVPVALLFTDMHDDYHRPADLPDRINAIGVERVATFAARLVLGLTEADERLTFLGFMLPTAAIPPPQFGAKHLLITYKGALRAADTVTRTRAAALERAGQARARAKAGEKLEGLVAEYSDEAGAAARGGDLGTFPRGRMLLDFQIGLEKTTVGEISEVVETPFGFHVLLRTR